MKEEYKQMRKTGQFKLEWFFKFYIQEFDKLKDTTPYFKRTLTFPEFNNVFRMYLQTSMDSILGYLDSIFDVCILTDKDSQLLMVVD